MSTSSTPELQHHCFDECAGAETRAQDQIVMVFRLPVPARMWLVAVWLACSLGQAASVAPLVVAPSGHW